MIEITQKPEWNIGRYGNILNSCLETRKLVQYTYKMLSFKGVVARVLQRNHLCLEVSRFLRVVLSASIMELRLEKQQLGTTALHSCLHKLENNLGIQFAVGERCSASAQPRL